MAFDPNESAKRWTIRARASEVTGLRIPSSRPPCHVIDRLYISNLLTASIVLKGIAPAYYPSTPKITHVLSVVSGKPEQIEVIRESQDSDIQHQTIILPDVYEANMLEYFPEICKFIHSALLEPNTNVLVHCFAGISRSATAITAYLVYAHRMTPHDAITQIRVNRPQVTPNAGFRAQLIVWQDMECQMMDENNNVKKAYGKGVALLELKSYYINGVPNLRALSGIERPDMR